MDDPGPNSWKRFHRPDPCRLHARSGPAVLEALARVAAGELPQDDLVTEQWGNLALLRHLGLQPGWYLITVNTNQIRRLLPPTFRNLDRSMVRLNRTLLGRGWRLRDKAKLVVQVARDHEYGFLHGHGCITYGEYDGRGGDPHAAALDAFRRFFRRGTVMIKPVRDAGGGLPTPWDVGSSFRTSIPGRGCTYSPDGWGERKHLRRAPAYNPSFYGLALRSTQPPHPGSARASPLRPCADPGTGAPAGGFGHALP